MNRTEALHILGLEDDATADDIKIAYRETVQILHPDKFAGNEKLQSRATEQFKRLQEAYDLLSSGAAPVCRPGAVCGHSPLLPPQSAIISAPKNEPKEDS